MVVLSVSICNKKGKILLARQYVPMSRIRVESLLSSFPTLINCDNRQNKQEYTFIEANNIRYLYQTMDDIYLLLLTNKQSNILEDFDTLKMIKTITPQFCGGFNQQNLVSNKIIDLIPVLDEIITPMGYKQHINNEEMKEYIEMNSLNEKSYEIMQQQQIKNQIKLMKMKAKQIEKEREEKPKISNDKRWNNSQIDTSFQYNTQYTPSFQRENVESKQKTNAGPSPSTGMRLRPKNNDVLSSSELKRLDEQECKIYNIGFSDNELKECNSNINDAIEILISDKLNVIFDHDSEIKQFQIKGDLQVIINDPNATQIDIQTNITPNTRFNIGKCIWKLHPKMDNNKWKKGILSFKDKNQKFKVGSSSKVSILKWILNIKDEKYIPITFSFWPEIESNDQIIISAKYIANTAMKNVIISFPTNSRQDAHVKQIENGNFVFDQNNNKYEWILNDLVKDDEGTVEFMVNEMDLENLYPISINFEMENSYSNIGIKGVYDVDNDNKYEYSTKNTCVAQKYEIE